MHSRVDEFRQRARHCEELAKETVDVAKRKFFLDLAEQWRDLASDAELLGTLPYGVGITQFIEPALDWNDQLARLR